MYSASGIYDSYSAKLCGLFCETLRERIFALAYTNKPPLFRLLASGFGLPASGFFRLRSSVFGPS